MMSIQDNLQKVQERIKQACLRAGRDPSEVRLIGVTKTVTPDRIRPAVEAGLKWLGENYVQEARKKMEELADLDICWHFIGHLQTNKARHAAESFSWVQTVDRVKLARELSKRAVKIDKCLQVLIQVHLGNEPTKSGVPPEKVWELYKEIESMDGLEVRGLMVIPPYLPNPEDVRLYFRELRNILESIRQRIEEPERFSELSMGMSHDFEVAIEEGATMVRIGTAIFGERR